jgi:AmmeMemoRadiSam system protein B
MGQIRHPSAIGFYPDRKEVLIDSIQSCFLDKFGPGDIPKTKQEYKGNIIAGVTPHAGYIYSGPVASHIFHAIAADGFPETFVLIGPKHMGMRFQGAAIMAEGAWSTPLGECPVDTDLAKAILSYGAQPTFCVDESWEAHNNEHSLEVQLPFLQYLNMERPVQIAPIVISSVDYKICECVGKAIAAGVNKTGRDVTILASTDFTHYGTRFYYTPAGSKSVETIIKWVYEKDQELVQKIKQLDGKNLLKLVVQERRTMCGHSAVATMLAAARQLGAKKGELLKYATSYDIRGGTDAVVGYAAMTVTR